MYNLLNKTTDIATGKKTLRIKNINLKKTSVEKYFQTHLKLPKTEQFNGSKSELTIHF